MLEGLVKDKTIGLCSKFLQNSSAIFFVDIALVGSKLNVKNGSNALRCKTRPQIISTSLKVIFDWR